MSLLDYLKLNKLSKSNHRKNNWPFRYTVTEGHKATRDEVAHFCEHDGIRICFTPARASWHAHVPSALKPWWLSLSPEKKNFSQDADAVNEKETRDEIRDDVRHETRNKK